jgi:hypothetical protein
MVVHGRRGQRAVVLLNDLLRLPNFELVAPAASEADAAYAAFVTYGRGSGHPAGLNFGDVFSYALAKVRGLPLLYKGADFAQTDIQSAAAALSGRKRPRDFTPAEHSAGEDLLDRVVRGISPCKAPAAPGAALSNSRASS